MTILPPAFAPSAAYYAAIARADTVRIAVEGLYDKRLKYTHRYEIADAQGRALLTVPIQQPHGIVRAAWRDVRVSGHGRWQEVHATALASAYGRTPFFEHYMPLLAPALLPDEGTMLTDAVAALNTAICRLLLVDTPISYCGADSAVLPEPAAMPYWQVWQDKHGFLGGLSVLDLLFNLGPEAALYIRK